MQIKVFEFNPISENSYLLYDETKEAVIIDCGASNPEEYQLLTDYIHRHQLVLKHVLNTHLHFDHVLGNHFLYETYGLKPQYHELEETIPALQLQASVFRFPIKYEPVKAEHFIQDGDSISFGNSNLKATLTPGHSPGSLSFYSEKENCVFTGDALFRYSIGRTDLWGGNENTLISAIKNRLLTLPDDTIIYPGHGPASTVIEEKLHNPYL
jgi:glyoxylase-like metal-dependent hydrolase (beta-lactamase superfamily II)